MARKNETPKLKDQINKPYGPKGQGKIKAYNSFDPLAKFDLICSYVIIMDTMNKISHSKEEKKEVRIPTRINVA